jgi:phosphatidylethanolamine/phosphatidyl-N-methylethanolamine N-methyltransferase
MSEDEFCNSVYGLVQGEGTCGWYVRQSHKALENGLPSFAADTNILELGCNLGEHSAYVSHKYQSYLATDYREIESAPLNHRIKFEVADAQSLSYEDNSFDLLIMTCVLHHLDHPDRALREMRRVARHGAVISIIVPTDPGIFYRVAKRMGPYKALMKLGRSANFEPQYFHYQQHRNHFPGISTFIKFIYRDDTIKQRFWPFPWKSWNLNLFTVFHIFVVKKPNESSEIKRP